MITVADPDGSMLFEHTVTDAEVDAQKVTLEDLVSVETYLQKVAEHGCHGGVCPLHSEFSPTAGTTAASYPCLDTNGIWSWTGNFIYSDCYMSLFAGPAQYSWMCWTEAMSTIHDHHGNIWCNGTYNCSLFVHNWNYNCQKWHTHSGSWRVGSGWRTNLPKSHF